MEEWLLLGIVLAALAFGAVPVKKLDAFLNELAGEREREAAKKRP